MGKSRSKVYFGALLAAFLFLAPSSSWAILTHISHIKHIGDPVYVSALKSFKKKDYHAAYSQWLSIAKTGNSKAQYYIGYMYLNGLYVQKDLNQARFWFERAAGRGDPDAQNDLGTLYLNGQGVHKNLDIAMKWFQLSAKQGHPVAQYNLGVIYTIRSKFRNARIWFEASAMQGYAKANFHLRRLLGLI